MPKFATGHECNFTRRSHGGHVVIVRVGLVLVELQAGSVAGRETSPIDVAVAVSAD